MAYRWYHAVHASASVDTGGSGMAGGIPTGPTRSEGTSSRRYASR